MQPHIRWMIRREMPAVLEIERSSFEFPWSEEDFLRCLRSRNCIGMVAVDEADRDVLGFMVYELHATRLHLLNLAVATEHRRTNVGRTMMEKLKRKLSANRRRRVVTVVRETNLAAQLFFRSCGFRATGILRDHYEDTTEDGYTFTYRHPGQVIGTDLEAAHESV
jgi:ribosomal-protein-alanine N-acetyltransferase